MVLQIQMGEQTYLLIPVRRVESSGSSSSSCCRELWMTVIGLIVLFAFVGCFLPCRISQNKSSVCIIDTEDKTTPTHLSSNHFPNSWYGNTTALLMCNYCMTLEGDLIDKTDQDYRCPRIQPTCAELTAELESVPTLFTLAATFGVLGAVCCMLLALLVFMCKNKLLKCNCLIFTFAGPFFLIGAITLCMAIAHVNAVESGTYCGEKLPSDFERPSEFSNPSGFGVFGNILMFLIWVGAVSRVLYLKNSDSD